MKYIIHQYTSMEQEIPGTELSVVLDMKLISKFESCGKLTTKTCIHSTEPGTVCMYRDGTFNGFTEDTDLCPEGRGLFGKKNETSFIKFYDSSFNIPVYRSESSSVTISTKFMDVKSQYEIVDGLADFYFSKIQNQVQKTQGYTETYVTVGNISAILSEKLKNTISDITSDNEDDLNSYSKRLFDAILSDETFQQTGLCLQELSLLKKNE